MDIATIIGIVGGFAVLIAAILLEGSNPMSFLHLLPAVVVVGGAAMAITVRYTLGSLISAIALGFKSSIVYKRVSPTQLIDQLAEIAETMRRQGPIALEQVEVDDPFLRRGVRMIADGYSAEALRSSLERERDLDYERVEESHEIFRRWATPRRAWAWSAR